MDRGILGTTNNSVNISGTVSSTSVSGEVDSRIGVIANGDS